MEGNKTIRTLKRTFSAGLVGLMAAYTTVSTPGCASLENFAPFHEAFRSDEKKNTEPVEIREGVDYNAFDYKRTHQFVVVNGRGYLEDSDMPQQTLEQIVEVPQLKKYVVPAIHGEYIEDGQGKIILRYPCRTPAPDLSTIISPYLPDAQITVFPNKNELIFYAKKEDLGNNFDKLAQILNQFDVSAKLIRVRTKIVEYFNDNTYDRESMIKILKENIGMFTINLPSSPDPTRTLTTGVSADPFMNKPRFHYSPITGEKIPNQWTYEGAISFLDSHGKTETLSDTDVLVSNGETVTYTNTNSVPYASFLISAATPIATSNYREIGTEISLIPYANEEGFTTIKLIKSASGEQTGYVGTEQRPTFREADLVSQFALKNGVTYFIGTSLNTRYKSVDRGIPVLNKLPLIKHLSTSRSIEKNATQLLYFMEVNVLDKDDLVGTQKEVLIQK